MFVGSDPTAVEAGEAVSSYNEEFDIDTIAQLQAFEAASLRARISPDGDGAVPEAGAMQAQDFAPEAEETAGPAGGPGGRELIPAPLPLQKVSGRYRGSNGSWQLELRVDVDRRNPLRMVSGDFYWVSGATTTYFGSFICQSISASVNKFSAKLTGVMEATFGTSYPRIKITIPRQPVLAPTPNATLQFQTLDGIPGATYVCQFESAYFRTILLEEDVTPGVSALRTYNTGSLPSGGPARDLSVAEAYREAGIDMQPTGGADIIPDAEASGDSVLTWSDAELHASMERHFTLWRNEPGWHVWLLHTNLHDLGPNLLGIMFDEMGQQRQGAAAFYASQSGSAPEDLRSQLYTCVHELGHCFNLFHSFHKEHMTPPRPNRLRALSYMNYPQRFPDGEAAFWGAFPFQFDREELTHLRHAFRNNVIMGGTDFGVGAALENRAVFRNALRDDSGLRLEVMANKRFVLGEPVSVTIRLTTTDQRGKRINASIHPDYGFVQIGIEKPDGRVMVYQPLINHCVVDRGTYLDSQHPSIETNAFIGYGRGGWYFDQPGYYKIRALYNAHDGSQVLSNILNLRVSSPMDDRDEEVADLLIGDQQGTLVYLMGSDADELRKGNDALELVVDKYPDHPVAAYARIVRANNEAREFKLITPENRLRSRSSNLEGATMLLSGKKKRGRTAAAAAEEEMSGLNRQVRLAAQAKLEIAESEAPTAMMARRTFEAVEPVSLPPNLATFLVAQIPQLAREFGQAAGEEMPRREDRVRDPADPGANR